MRTYEGCPLSLYKARPVLALSGGVVLTSPTHRRATDVFIPLDVVILYSARDRATAGSSGPSMVPVEWCRPLAILRRRAVRSLNRRGLCGAVPAATSVCKLSIGIPAYQMDATTTKTVLLYQVRRRAAICSCMCRRARWLGRWSACLLRSICGFKSHRAHARRGFFLHK